MKKLLILILICSALACQNKRIVELAQIEKANITDVLDVSPVYMFFDNTATDSVVFNRKNMISTTNWLVNIDRRLTLKQVFPHLQYLQEKRQKAGMHKNENAKNYYTCNDLSRSSIGFIEFSNINYLDTLSPSELQNEQNLFLFFDIENAGEIKNTRLGDLNFKIDTLKDTISNYLDNSDGVSRIFLAFHNELTFQKYIDYKVLIMDLKEGLPIISNNEFFLNLNLLN